MKTPSLSRPEREAFFVSGAGMHSGKPVQVRGSALEPGSGMWLSTPHRRIEIAPNGLCAAMRCSRMEGIGPLEHFAAGFALAGIFDWMLEVSAADLPLLDGSASFCKPARQRSIAWLDVPAGWRGEIRSKRGGLLLAEAADDFLVASVVEVGATRQRWQGSERDLADCLNARTFVDVDAFASARAAGLLRGCEIGQGILFGPARTAAGEGLTRSMGLPPDAPVLVGAPLRMPSEAAAHKTLDLVGDLALWLRGLPRLRIEMTDVGHREFHELGRALLDVLPCSGRAGGARFSRHV